MFVQTHTTEYRLTRRDTNSKSETVRSSLYESRNRGGRPAAGAAPDVQSSIQHVRKVWRKLAVIMFHDQTIVQRSAAAQQNATGFKLFSY